MIQSDLNSSRRIINFRTTSIRVRALLIQGDIISSARNINSEGPQFECAHPKNDLFLERNKSRRFDSEKKNESSKIRSSDPMIFFYPPIFFGNGDQLYCLSLHPPFFFLIPQLEEGIRDMTRHIQCVPNLLFFVPRLEEGIRDMHLTAPIFLQLKLRRKGMLKFSAH